MHPDGFPCLVCQTRTKSEGQLCPECVTEGHYVENGTLHVSLTFYMASADMDNVTQRAHSGGHSSVIWHVK